MSNTQKVEHPKDFFGNDIEVGDEVAVPWSWDHVVRMVVTKTQGLDSNYFEAGAGYATQVFDGSFVFVNTEKKHREKALDYLAAEAQEIGGYE